MVKIDSFNLPAVLQVGRGKGKLLADKPVVGDEIATRTKQTGKNETFLIYGEFRWQQGTIPTGPGELQALNDGSDRTLNLEDGSDTITVLIDEIKFDRDALSPGFVPYRVKLIEKDNPT